MEATTTELNWTETRQMHSGRKEVMRKLGDYSRDSDAIDVEEWQFELTNLFASMKLKDKARVSEPYSELLVKDCRSNPTEAFTPTRIDR